MGRGGGGEGNIQQEEFQNKSQQFKIARTSFGVHSPTTYWSYFIFYFKYLSYSSQQFLDRPKVRRHCSYATCCGQAHCDPKSKHRHVRQLLSCSFCLLQLQFRLQFLSFFPFEGSDEVRGLASLSSAYVQNTCRTRFIIVPRVVSQHEARPAGAATRSC